MLLNYTLHVPRYRFDQSLTKVAVLLVIRSGIYEDRQKFTLCWTECPTQFSPILSKYFLLPTSSMLRMFVCVTG